MASAEGDLLTAAYRRQQLAVRAGALQDVSRAWQLWTPGRVESFGRFTDLAVPLLAARYGQAAALAAGYYRRFRAAEGAKGADPAKLPAPLRPEDVIPSLRATGLAGTMRALRAGFSAQAASRAGLTQALGSAGRLTLNGGRAAIVAAVGADPAAKGWQRIASGGACDFCRMLASRGPAYKSDRTADFLAHDHCACSAEPVFEEARAPAKAERSEPPGEGAPPEEPQRTPAQARQAVTAAAAAVAAVVRLPDDLPKPALMVVPGTSIDGNAGIFTVGAGIRVAQAGPTPQVTYFHEYAHYLDWHVLGRPGRYGTEDRDDPDLAPVLARIRSTPAFRELAQRFAGDPDRLDYLQGADELWARSFAQWMVRRSTDPDVRRQLQSGPLTWSDAEFAPIDEAITELLRRKGLLR